MGLSLQLLKFVKHKWDWKWFDKVEPGSFIFTKIPVFPSKFKSLSKWKEEETVVFLCSAGYA